jgi:hypothetical protein
MKRVQTVVAAPGSLRSSFEPLIRHRPRAASIVAAAFVAALLTSSTAWAGAFSIVDTQYEVWVRLVTYGGTSLQNDHRVSTDPLLASITDTVLLGENGEASSAWALAVGPYVGVNIVEYPLVEQGAHADAMAISSLTFVPTFDGSAKEILMWGQQPAEGWLHAEQNWVITDLTTHTTVAAGDLELIPAPQPLIYATPGPYAWDSTHTYQLRLVLETGGNHLPDGGYLTTNLFAQNVPDDVSTLFLLPFGLAAIAVWRRRAL